MSVSRILVTIGVVLVVMGLLWPLVSRIGLGRLPGDVVIERDGFRLYIPITTSILVSLALTLLFRLFRK